MEGQAPVPFTGGFVESHLLDWLWGAQREARAGEAWRRESAISVDYNVD